MFQHLRLSRTGVIATTVLLASSMIFSACGSTSSSTTSSATPAPSSSSATSGKTDSTAALPEVKLTWYVGGTFPQPEQDAVFAEVNKVIKSKINATVDFKTFSFGEFDQKMQVVIASGEPYDLTFTSNWMNNYSQNVAKGAFLPLDDLLVKYAPKSYASVPKTFWEATKVKGKIYGFVNQQISARTPAVEFPKEFVDKYSIDTKALSGKLTVDNLTALEPILEKIKKDYPDKAFITGLNMYQDAFDFETIVGINVPGAVAYSDDSLKVINQYESPSVKKFAAIMRDWNAKGYLNSKERISKKSDEWAEAKAGKWSIDIGGAYKPGGDVLASNLGGTPYAGIPAGTPHLTTGGIVATMHAINRNSKNPERAMMLLELLNTDKDLYNLLNFGIKDKHYKIDADGYMVPGDNQKGYNPQVPWMFATNYLANVEKGMPKTVWEDTKKINDSAIPSKLLGFTFNAEPVKGEIGKVSAVYDEYYRSIDLGVTTEDKYNEFVAKLKTAGSDKILAEMQKQIDAWKASK